MKPFLKRSEPPDAGMQRLVLGLIDEAASGDDTAGGMERVHGLRTAIKRLRAYLRLVRAKLEEDYFVEVNVGLRDSARGLAQFRDKAVILQTVRDLRDRARRAPLHEALEKAAVFLDAALPAEDGADEWRGAAEDAAGALRTMAASFEQQALEASGWRLLQGGLRRTYRKARRLMRRWADSRRIEDAHEWRKFSKYLMFQVQLLERAWPEELGRLRRRLSKLETCLGKANDLRMLEDAFLALMPECDIDTDACGDVRRAMVRRRESLIGQAARLGERIFDRTPKDFVAMIRKRWRRWHRAGGGASRADRRGKAMAGEGMSSKEGLRNREGGPG